jgi:hypothetical protein
VFHYHIDTLPDYLRQHGYEVLGDFGIAHMHFSAKSSIMRPLRLPPLPRPE